MESREGGSRAPRRPVPLARAVRARRWQAGLALTLRLPITASPTRLGVILSDHAGILDRLAASAPVLARLPMESKVTRPFSVV